MNPTLTEPWTGPASGLPAFDRVRVADLKPALEFAMDEYRREIARIVADPAPPTFANVVAALEEAGELLRRVSTYYRVWTSTMRDAEVRALQAEMSPRLAAFADELVQNAALFAKLDAVKARTDLSATERRVTELRHLHHVLRGARLDERAQARVAEINQRLARLGTDFDTNVLADEEKPALVITDSRELAGLAPAFVDAARAEAERLGLGAAWVISNTRSSAEPFLTFARDRAARERVFRAWTARGQATNPPLAAEMLKLRAERAALYGYPSHAHWKLADKMIRDPADALALMMKVWRPAVTQVGRDVAAMRAIVAREGGDFAFEPWDYRYYAEKVRQERFDLDLAQVRPFMRFENVRDAMFGVAKRLYGLEFEALGGVPIYHPDVTVYEVRRDGATFGVFYLDPFARPGKSSGAWMSAYRTQTRDANGRRPPIVSNNLNFIKAAAGAPTLLSWDDARTMFHEFGHALHGLNSDVPYASVAGTAVPTDYVEFPSHFHENYLGTPEVLAQLVNEEGLALPASVVDKLRASETFNSGFATVEFLASGIVDLRLHLASGDVDPERFAADALAEIGLPREIVMRHGIPHFNHVFSGDAYSAGYYSYLWSDVMASDGFAAFTEAGGPYDPVVARRLLDHVLSVGNLIEPKDGFRRFRGRDADVGALLKARGLTEAP